MRSCNSKDSLFSQLHPCRGPSPLLWSAGLSSRLFETLGTRPRVRRSVNTKVAGPTQHWGLVSTQSSAVQLFVYRNIFASLEVKGTSPVVQRVKNLPAVGFHPWVGKIPQRRRGQPTPVFLPEKSHGQITAWWARVQRGAESDTAEQLSARAGRSRPTRQERRRAKGSTRALSWLLWSSV